MKACAIPALNVVSTASADFVQACNYLYAQRRLEEQVGFCNRWVAVPTIEHSGKGVGASGGSIFNISPLATCLGSPSGPLPGLAVGVGAVASASRVAERNVGSVHTSFAYMLGRRTRMPDKPDGETTEFTPGLTLSLSIKRRSR